MTGECVQGIERLLATQTCVMQRHTAATTWTQEWGRPTWLWLTLSHFQAFRSNQRQPTTNQHFQTSVM